MTDELDTDGNEIANTAMEYKEIADYWCITAGYTGADQFSTVKGKETDLYLRSHTCVCTNLATRAFYTLSQWEMQGRQCSTGLRPKSRVQ
jgi:hypothetical protein